MENAEGAFTIVSWDEGVSIENGGLGGLQGIRGNGGYSARANGMRLALGFEL